MSKMKRAEQEARARENLPTLSKEHRQMLLDSGIREEVIEARGYKTASRLNEAWMRLEGGFGEAASQRLPALLLPVYQTRSEQPYKWMSRPDDPFVDAKGKTRKYESPHGYSNVLDTHPMIREAIGDPEVILGVTEGAKKADALISAGVACFSISGVNGWRGRNEQGGLVALPDWQDVHLKDRDVILFPDSDYRTNKNVGKAFSELARYLRSKGAKVETLVPPAGENEKVGIDDWLASGLTLDDLRAAQPQKSEEEDAEPDDGIGPTPDEPVDGAQLIEDLVAYQSRYIVTSDDAKIVAAFWVLHTYCIDAAHYTPYLVPQSPVRRCGKSLYLDLLRLVTRKSLLATDTTVAGLFRETDPHTAVFLDEQDGLGDESYRKYLNAGFQRGRLVIRADNDRGATATVKFEPFAPKMLASIGNLPDTITDRAFVIELRRKLGSETVERFRERKVIEVAQPIRERCAWWSDQNLAALKFAEPDLPEGLDDRAQDIAEPLLAIAEKIGGRFVQDLADAMVRMRSGDNAEDGDEKIRLLADIRTAFTGIEEGDDPERFVGSSGLITLITKDKDSPWREHGWRQEKLTPVAMAAMLREFGIRPIQHQVLGERHKGYFRRQFEDAWSRFLTPEAAVVTPLHLAPLHSRMEKQDECNGATRKEVAPLAKENGKAVLR